MGFPFIKVVCDSQSTRVVQWEIIQQYELQRPKYDSEGPILHYKDSILCT